MPLYEYQCTRCGKRTEKIQSVHAEPLRECEACGGALERLISPPAIQFKGSGWYITDYARKSSVSNGAADKKDATADGKGDKAGESKPETKSEAKSESKGESKKN